MEHKNIFYFLLILIFNFFYIRTNTLQEIHPIINGKLNGTAAFVSLDNIEHNETYVYFSFEFNYHNLTIKKHKIAYFLVTSDFELNETDKIEYGFVEEKLDEIKNINDIKHKNIKWRTMELLYKEKPYNDINYYFRIKKTMKVYYVTAIIRIPINGRKEGALSVENIIQLPDFNKKETNPDL